MVARRADKWLMPEWGPGSAIVAGGQFTYRWFVAEDFQETFNVQDYDDVVEIRTEDQQMVASMWVEPQWQSERWYVGLGVRGAAYTWDDQTTFQPEPRLSIRRQMPKRHPYERSRRSLHPTASHSNDMLKGLEIQISTS